MSKEQRVIVCVLLAVVVVVGLASPLLLEVLEGVGEELRFLWHWFLALPL